MRIHRIGTKPVEFFMVGLLLSVVFWALDSVVNSVAFGQGTIRQQMFAPTGAEIWVRMFVACLLMGLSYCAGSGRLFASGARFRALVEHNYDVMNMFSADGELMYTSPSVKRVLGYEPEELIGQRGPKLVHPDDLEAAARGFAEGAQQPRAVSQFVLRLRHKDGSYRTVEITGTNLLDQAGVNAMVSIFRDVTDRDAAQEALKQSEERHRSVVLALSEGIALYDSELRLVMHNTSATKMLGLTADRLTDAMQLVSHLQAVREDGSQLRPEDFPAVQTLRNGTALKRQIMRIVATDRQFRWVSMNTQPLIHDDQQTPYAVVVSFEDISDRKLAEAEQQRVESALRESERKFRSLSDRNPAMVAIVQGKKLRYANAALEEMSGYTNEELLRMDFVDLLHSDHRDLVKERSTERQRGGSVPSRYELKYRTKSGAPRWLDFSASLIDYEGSPAVCGIGVDITDRKIAEERLQQKETELAHVSRLSVMGEMVAGIAHEINQPLYAISNFATASKLMLDAADSQRVDRVQELNHQIAVQAVRAGEIVKRLCNFVKKTDAGRSTFDANEMVREALDLLEPTVRHYQVSQRLELVSRPASVHADRVQIQQVLVNVVRNAIESMIETAVPRRVLTIQTSMTENELRLSVIDQGHGIPPETVNEVFEPFYSTKKSGLGMGLAVSRTIVEAHGGRIWTEPGDPGGTNVHFTLPLASEKIHGL